MKQSKLRRKYVNAMDSMADVPKPARRFKYPPTFAPVGATARWLSTSGRDLPTCERLIDVKWKRRRIRRSKPEFKVCGAPLMLVPFQGRLECPVHRTRSADDRRWARLEKPTVFARLRREEPWSVAKAASGRIFSRGKV